MSESLTSSDVQILIDSIDFWVQAGQSERMIERLIGALLTRNDDENRVKIESELEKTDKEYAAQRQLKEEKAIELKYKLTKIRKTLAS